MNCSTEVSLSLLHNFLDSKAGGFNNLAKRAEDDIEMLRQKLLPQGFGMGGGGGDPFPEDFVFRQNEFRSEDLEVEERALVSL